MKEVMRRRVLKKIAYMVEVRKQSWINIDGLQVTY